MRAFKCNLYGYDMGTLSRDFGVNSFKHFMAGG
jgi:hypothetical protein